MPVPIPGGVTVVVEDERVVRVKGPNGELTHPVLLGTRVVVEGAEARVLGRARGPQPGLRDDARQAQQHGARA